MRLARFGPGLLLVLLVAVEVQSASSHKKSEEYEGEEDAEQTTKAPRLNTTPKPGKLKRHKDKSKHADQSTTTSTLEPDTEDQLDGSSRSGNLEESLQPSGRSSLTRNGYGGHERSILSWLGGAVESVACFTVGLACSSPTTPKPQINISKMTVYNNSHMNTQHVNTGTTPPPPRTVTEDEMKEYQFIMTNSKSDGLNRMVVTQCTCAKIRVSDLLDHMFPNQREDKFKVKIGKDEKEISIKIVPSSREAYERNSRFGVAAAAVIAGLGSGAFAPFSKLIADGLGKLLGVYGDSSTPSIQIPMKFGQVEIGNMIIGINSSIVADQTNGRATKKPNPSAKSSTTRKPEVNRRPYDSCSDCKTLYCRCDLDSVQGQLTLADSASPYEKDKDETCEYNSRSAVKSETETSPTSLDLLPQINTYLREQQLRSGSLRSGRIKCTKNTIKRKKKKKSGTKKRRKKAKKARKKRKKRRRTTTSPPEDEEDYEDDDDYDDPEDEAEDGDESESETMRPKSLGVNIQFPRITTEEPTPYPYLVS